MKKIIITVLILIVSLPAFGSYKDALELFQKKQYKAALKKVADQLVVKDDLKKDSPNFNLRYLAAHIHWKLKNYTSARLHFQRCMQIDKKNINPYIDLALMQIDEKNYNLAIQTATLGRGIKENVSIVYVLGKAILLQKNYWRAKTIFEKANTIKSDFYASYNGLGMALMGLKKFSEANVAFSAAYAIYNKSPEILNNLALSIELSAARLNTKNKKKRYKEAYDYFKKAYEYGANNKTILENIKRIRKKIKALK